MFRNPLPSVLLRMQAGVSECLAVGKAISPLALLYFDPNLSWRRGSMLIKELLINGLKLNHDYVKS